MQKVGNKNKGCLKTRKVIEGQVYQPIFSILYRHSVLERDKVLLRGWVAKKITPEQHKLLVGMSINCLNDSGSTDKPRVIVTVLVDYEANFNIFYKIIINHLHLKFLASSEVQQLYSSYHNRLNVTKNNTGNYPVSQPQSILYCAKHNTTIKEKYVC